MMVLFQRILELLRPAEGRLIRLMCANAWMMNIKNGKGGVRERKDEEYEEKERERERRGTGLNKYGFCTTLFIEIGQCEKEPNSLPLMFPSFLFNLPVIEHPNKLCLRT